MGNYVLSSAHIGKSKEVLDLTELDLPVLSVISTFGHYVKFKVQSTAVSTNVVSTNSGVTNAYKILMSNARMQNASQLPAEKPVRSNKDRLYNDILKFLHDQNLKWKENVISSGERFVNLLAQILWYIDGHHHLFDERSNTKLPQIFAQFQNYTNQSYLSTGSEHYLTCVVQQLSNMQIHWLHVYRAAIGIILHGKNLNRKWLNWLNVWLDMLHI